VTLPVRGFGRVLFCHGSPRDDEEVLLVDTRMARWQEAFAAVREDVRTIVCGHTHMPFLRLVDRRVVVNPGSVGMPYGGAGAHWALLRDGAVTLRHTAYDVDAASRDICATSTFEGCAQWVDYYLRSRASDVEALETFGPRDGRAAG
jgi:diadenosine tetraphosphatase ApaH/serine/threonine PP2A family protein phosphatase